METNNTEINQLSQIVDLKNSNLELLGQVSQLAHAIKNLQLALENLHCQIEKQQLNILQIEFQKEVKLRNLDADFRETLAELDLD
ncbi:MAG: hypothetical protein WBB28_04050 [Crinalium sp.]